MRTYPPSLLTYASALEALEKSLDVFKAILKKQMMIFLRRRSCGYEYEEICYNV